MSDDNVKKTLWWQINNNHLETRVEIFFVPQSTQLLLLELFAHLAVMIANYNHNGCLDGRMNGYIIDVACARYTIRYEMTRRDMNRSTYYTQQQQLNQITCKLTQLSVRFGLLLAHSFVLFGLFCSIYCRLLPIQAHNNLSNATDNPNFWQRTQIRARTI